MKNITFIYKIIYKKLFINQLQTIGFELKFSQVKTLLIFMNSVF